MLPAEGASVGFASHLLKLGETCMECPPVKHAQEAVLVIGSTEWVGGVEVNCGLRGFDDIVLDLLLHAQQIASDHL